MLKTQKKRNSLLSLAVCLLMLASLIIPANTQEASAAAATNLQNPRIEEDKSVTWDCITFGHYPQGEYIPQKKPKLPKENEMYRDADDTCFVYVKNPENNMSHYYKVEPIKWRVLSINGDEAMLLSDKNIDGGKAYNESDTNVTWETCTIRSWLNGYNGTSNRDGISYTSVNFMDKAFSEKEQSAIKEKKIVTADNLYYDTDGGADTLDKICLPSIEEVMNPLFGFPSDPELETRIRESINTEYAASQYWMDNGTPDWWRLRSPGERASNVAYVRESGDVYADGDFVYHYGGFAVRPILYLDLNSELWSYAETVNSSDTQPWEEEPETIEKASQTIAAVSVIKAYGSKPFNLNAKAKGKLTYKSSDTKVAAVSAAGIVTIKGPGKATITITAAATSAYKAAPRKSPSP